MKTKYVLSLLFAITVVVAMGGIFYQVKSSDGVVKKRNPLGNIAPRIVSYKGHGSEWNMTLDEINLTFSFSYSPTTGGAPTVTASGDVEFLESGFVKLNVVNSSGVNAPPQGSVLWGLKEDRGAFILQNSAPAPVSPFITMIEMGACPSNSIGANFAVTNHYGSKLIDEPTNVADGARVIGSVSLTNSNAELLFPNTYTAANLSLGPLPSLTGGNCANGVVTFTNSDVTAYVSRDSSMMSLQFPSSSGDLTAIAFKSSDFNLSLLDGDFKGFFYDSGSPDIKKNIKVHFDSSGNGQVDEVDPLTDTILTSNILQLAMPSDDSPLDGMLRGEYVKGAVTRKILCNVKKLAGPNKADLIHCVSGSFRKTTPTTNKILSFIVQRVSEYPRISKFSEFPSSQPLIDLSIFNYNEVQTQPYYSSGAGSTVACMHEGAHIHFARGVNEQEYEIRSPVKGKISMIDDCDTDNSTNDQYSMTIDFAKYDGSVIQLQISFEPMMGVGICMVNGANNNVFTPYLYKTGTMILWAVGDDVNVGDIIGRMYVPSGTGIASHIHFNLKRNNEEVRFCPNIFSSTLADQFDDKYRDPCPTPAGGGVPYNANDGFCNFPSTGVDILPANN